MTATPTPAANEHDRAPIELPHRERIEILIAVLLGIFLAALDQTIVGTALPVIVSDLEGNDVYTWAFTSYLLTATVSGPIYGKLSDIFGRRPLFILGVAIFLLGSILCGLSQEMWQFIAFRGLQGLGAGALFPIALAIIGDIFSPSERGKYQGFFGAVFGVSTLVGPAIGGLITDNFGWHWIFYVNVPIGAVVLYVIWRVLPTRQEQGVDRHIDYLGAAFLVAALVPMLIGFTNKQFGEWTDPDVGGLIVLGLALAAAFVFVESRAREPIVPLGLFRIRSFTASVIAFFFAIIGFFAAVVFLPRWFQFVLGSSAHGERLPDPPAPAGPHRVGRHGWPGGGSGGAVQDPDRRVVAGQRLWPVPADQHPPGDTSSGSCGCGWRSLALVWDRPSRSSRWSSRTACRCGHSARRPAA